MRADTPPISRHRDHRPRRCILHLRSAFLLRLPGPSARPESQAGKALRCIYHECRHRDQIVTATPGLGSLGDGSS
jgi:hypothetical protein